MTFLRLDCGSERMGMVVTGNGGLGGGGIVVKEDAVVKSRI